MRRRFAFTVRPTARTAGMVVVIAAWGFALSCSSSDDVTGPSVTTGTISVTTSTTGEDAPASYTLSLDGGAARTIDATGTATFAAVSAGSHTVALTGAPSNCAVAGTNPRTVAVAAGASASVTFSVSCVPLTGSLVVETVTTGSDVDGDGYTLSVDGGTPTPVGVNQSLAAVELPIGEHQVELGDVAANCMVAGANPRIVTVTIDQVVSTTFDVMCDATTGAIEVTTTTSGEDFDADGYSVDLDGTSSQPIGVNETVTFTGVPPGDHSLILTGLASNCAVAGANPESATVVAGETDGVAFDVVCSALVGDLRVTANTTGTPLDPDGYLAGVDGGTPQALGVNGDTITFGSVDAGDRSILLSGIDAGCVVTGSNPAQSSVPAGGEALHAFDVSCTSNLGAIELTTATTGVDPDPDGYTISVDGAMAVAIGSDDTAVFADLAAGSHSLTLGDIAANCSVQGANPETAIVMGNDTTDVTMTVDCEDIPNVAPVAGIATPDTTSTSAPQTVAPGTAVTFSGSALDAEDGAITGAALVWTSNLDGQIGTGESFMTSSLSEGQHTVTLTATDSEFATGSETTLVIVVPPAAPGYQIHLRLEEGTTLTASQAMAIDDALTRLESIITGDLPDVPIAFPAGNCGAEVPPTDETVDDLLLYLAIEPIDGPGGILGAAGPCVLRSGSSLPILGGMRFDAADLTTIIEPNGLLDELLLHEAMHVMGFGTIWTNLGLLQDPSDPNRGGTPGNDTHFTGIAAIAQFLVLGGATYTGGNIVPVENDNSSFGSGSLDGHWRESVFGAEIMTPAVNLGVNPLSVLTVGQFDDLGYSVNLTAADPYTPVFSLELSGAIDRRRILLEDDIHRGPLWVVDPTGRAVRIR